MDRKLIGSQGEAFVASYLSKQGFSILQNNYQTRFGEIDVIAQEKDTLVFIEVKTRSNLRYGSGAEMISRSKLFKLRKAIHSYLVMNDLLGRRYRIDAALVMKTGEEYDVRYYRNVGEGMGVW